MNPFQSPNQAAAANAVSSGAGAAVTLTYAADDPTLRCDTKGVSHVIGGVSVSYSAAPAATAGLTIKDGAAVVFAQDIVLAGPTTFYFKRPLKGTPGNKMDIVAGAGGGAIVAKISVLEKWIEP